MSNHAGDFRQRVVIEHFEQIQDENTGEITESWSEFGTFWAKFLFLSSKELLQAQAVQSNIKARLVVRYSKLTAKIDRFMRVLYRGHYYQIVSEPIPDHRSGLEWIVFELALDINDV